ncbi:MAG: carbamoyltransferase family protein [Desulforhopalus sp.]
MPEYILGLSAYYHDSAAALLEDGNIIAACHEERFTRKKHDASFPENAVKYVLDEAGIDFDDLAAVAFYDKPYLKFERLLETYHQFAPRGLKSFISSMPVWIKEKLFMKKLIKSELSNLSQGKIAQLLFPEHHLSHAASAFFPSPFEEAAIVTIDGVGEWATTSIGHGRGNTIRLLRQLDFPHSLGLLYSSFTYYCGFKVNSGEYKLMGLAPYGNPRSARVQEFTQLIEEHLVDIREDYSFLLNMEYFDFATGLTMCAEKKWQSLFGVPRRKPESDLRQEYIDLALAIQLVTEKIVIGLAKTAKQLTGCQYLTMAGGVALNCVANGKLLRANIFKDLWVQPAAGDAGGALGAAYAGWHIWNKGKRHVSGNDAMNGTYLGPEFSSFEIKRSLRRYNAVYEEYDKFDILCHDVSEFLAKGAVVGWFQGRMEYGPRALGNRSILADPRDPDTQKTLNLKIKYREGFRPFAPSVLEEDIEDYFDLPCPSPYMLLVADVKDHRRKPVPDDYAEKEMWEKLYYTRSDIHSVTHVDYSARIQSVSKKTNPPYWNLINAFKENTGFALLVNTSFNVRGEPIVCTPADAYRCFMRTEMDYLVLGNCVLHKRDQPPFPETLNWKETYELD